ncbi:hypothetical protein EDD11_009254 [Mortierella claussenii]|nr:hypothetical protein EDD11_009254 [Mortierella claussenii]
MSNITDRASNTANSYIGGAKQTIGQTVGNTDLAASGAAQKASADVRLAAGEAKTKMQGVADQLQGNIQQEIGGTFGDDSELASGKANELKGKIERNMTKVAEYPVQNVNHCKHCTSK